MVGFYQAVAGKKKFIFQFKYGQEGDMDSCSLLYVCSKEELGHNINKTIYGILKNKVY